ncbi:MAG: Hpt domain-containing protein [bacterium]
MEANKRNTEKVTDLDALVDNDAPDLQVNFIDEYLTSTEQGLKILRYAICANDSFTVTRTAQSMKGASNILGAKTMTELAEQLERLSRGASLTGAVELVDKLTSEFSLVRTDLRQL